MANSLKQKNSMKKFFKCVSNFCSERNFCN